MRGTAPSLAAASRATASHLAPRARRPRPVPCPSAPPPRHPAVPRLRPAGSSPRPIATTGARARTHPAASHTPPPTDLLPPTRREPKPLPQPVSATPGADQITGGQLWLRLPGPAPRPPSLHQPPGAAPPLRAAGGGLAAEGAPCSPGGHGAHAAEPGGGGEWEPEWDPWDVAAAPAPGGSPQLSRAVWQGQEDWHSSHRHYPQPSSLVNSVMGFYYYFNKLFCVRSGWLCYLPLDV